jgi:hypothetical protein
MADFEDNVNQFLQHCTKFHYLLETDVPMYDVDLIIMTYIIGWCILYVSNKVLDDLQKTISAFTKSQSKDLQLYMKPIANCLMQLNADDKFSVGNFKALHDSIMATSGAATPVVSREHSGAAASPIVSGEQNTPMTSN